MADRGRVGSLVVASRRCARKTWSATHEAHRNRVRHVTAATDHTTPLTADVAPTRNNLKKERILEDRYGEIDRDNRILMQKIKENNRKKPEFFQSGPQNLPTSLNIQHRRKEMLEITKENHRLVHAMKEIRPVYSAQRWADNDRHNQDLLKNCASYPIITRVPRSVSAPSLLVPLQPVAVTA